MNIHTHRYNRNLSIFGESAKSFFKMLFGNCGRNSNVFKFYSTTFTGTTLMIHFGKYRQGHILTSSQKNTNNWPIGNTKVNTACKSLKRYDNCQDESKVIHIRPPFQLYLLKSIKIAPYKPCEHGKVQVSIESA